MNDRDNLYRLSHDEAVLLHIYRRLTASNQDLVRLLADTAAEQSQAKNPGVIPFMPALHG